MIKFDKPKNLNGAELRKELLNAGVKIGNNATEVVIDEYGDFWLDISKADVSKTEPIVSSFSCRIYYPIRKKKEVDFFILNLKKLKRDGN